jgi:hypothetical protein
MRVFEERLSFGCLLEKPLYGHFWAFGGMPSAPFWSPVAFPEHAFQ